MSDDGYKFQTSIKHGRGLVAMTNVRANDPDEWEANISAVISAGPTINDAIEALGVVEVLAQGGVKTEVVSGGAPALDPEVPVCKHGAMVPRSGADWAGYFCTREKSDPDRCKPVYPKKKG